MMSHINTRIIALGIVITGMLIFVFSIGFLLLKPSVENANSTALPDQAAGLRLTSVSSGNQALREITQLHGKEFPLVSGDVGRYGDNNQVIVWVAEAADIAAAEKILLAMRNRIDEGNSPFTPIGELQIEDRTIFTLDGLGQVHFYFQSGKQIVWVAADVPQVEKALQQFVDYYP